MLVTFLVVCMYVEVTSVLIETWMLEILGRSFLRLCQVYEMRVIRSKCLSFGCIMAEINPS